MAALEHIAPGGVVIFDNSDWYRQAGRTLREGGLIQVDMSGFGPINGLTWMTSFFFAKEFHFSCASPDPPAGAVGSVRMER